jgi:hypothetical protein
MLAQLARRRVLVQPHPGLEGGAPQAERELARVDEGRPGAVPEPSVVRRRADLGPHRVRVEQLDVVPVLAAERSRLLELVRLCGIQQRADVAGPLELAVDAEAPDVCDEALEALEPEPLELARLLGEAGDPVLETVGQRGDGEAAVSPARPEAADLGLEHDHVAAGVVGLRVERCPEPRVAAPDDAEIGLDRPDQRAGGIRRRQLREPERARLGIRVRGALGGRRRRRRPGRRHACSSATRRTSSRQSGPTASRSSVYCDGLKQIDV